MGNISKTDLLELLSDEDVVRRICEIVGNQSEGVTRSVSSGSSQVSHTAGSSSGGKSVSRGFSTSEGVPKSCSMTSSRTKGCSVSSGHSRSETTSTGFSRNLT